MTQRPIEKDENHTELYTSDFYKTFYSFKKQEKAANAVISRVLKHCTGEHHFPKITTLIDLGCGDGYLLNLIVQKLRTESSNSKITAYGIDIVDPKVVGRDPKNPNQVTRDFEYIQANLNDIQFDRLNALTNVKWENTAVLCLCHTWFYFRTDDVYNALRTKRPALVLIGVYHTWDEVISKLETHPERAELEPRAYDDSHALYSLRTEWKDRTKREISRGVSKRASNSKEEEFLFPTTQVAKHSEELFGTNVEPLGKDHKYDANAWREIGCWAASEENGELTGGLNYVLAAQFEHESGWGRMLTRALLAVQPTAEILNDAYREAIEGVVRWVFINQSNVSSDAIRSLLNQFNAPGLKRGEREAAIIEPFDPNRVFARVCSLFPDISADDIKKLRTILEPPEQFQLRYRSAYALYRTMLDLVSSPESFPLSKLPGYEYSGVDLIYEDMENRLLSTNGDGTILSDSFFILPLYFGSLPVLALILPSLSGFPRYATNADVYQAFFRNIHDQIRLLLTDEFVATRILRPFIARALGELRKRLGDAIGDHHSITAQLNTIRKFLDGAEHWNADASTDPGGVLGRPWKSWLVTIPSIPLKLLDRTVAENRVLIDLFRREAKRASLDPELLLSSWFETRAKEHKFFGGPLHERYCEEHKACLWAMYELLGIDIDRSQIGDLAATLRNSIPAKEYFGSAIDHFLLDWLCKRSGDLLNDSHPFQKEDIFEDLKAVFCKTLENGGTGVRFGIRRLKCLFDAAGSTPKITPPLDDVYKLDALEGRYFSPKDPSLNIAKFVRAVGLLLERPIKSDIDWGPRENGAKIKVAIDIGEEIKEQGRRCREVKDAWEKIKDFADIGAGPLGQRRFELILDIELRDKDIYFDREK